MVYSSALSNIRHVPNDFDVSTFELMEATFNHHQEAYRIVTVYRPGHPGTDHDFMEEFGSLLEGLLAKNGKLVICGDFNYWLDDPTSKPYSSEFAELLSLNNFLNHVCVPTHISGHILDLVLTPTGSDHVKCVETLPIDRNISDHAMVTFDLAMAKPATYTKKITFRSYRNIDQESIAQSIRHNLSSISASLQTANSLVASYNNFFLSVRDRFCPLRTKTIKIRDNAPWFDHTVVSLRKQRRRAEGKWRRLRTVPSRLEYVSARRAVVDQISRCKVDYYKNQLTVCEGNPRRIFSVLNDLLGRSSAPVLPSSASDATLASDFASFFASKIACIREEVSGAPVDQEFSVDLASDFVYASTFSQFSPVGGADVLRYIGELNKTYCQLDPIDVSKLGSAFVSAAPFVADIINHSFRESNFVVSEKQALIRPHLKKIGVDRNEMANYRPVSNLTYLSKIMERAILDQLRPFLEQCGVISQYQSAYRKFHSTETALCKIYNDLVCNACLGKASLLILLDLSAAFDTVDHQMLLEDLSAFGVNGSAYLLLQSYLSDRDQRVIVGESTSKPTSLQFGVPQGSVLGPILFIVYTSSLVSLLEAHGVKYHFYADDTQLYIEIDNIEDVKDKAMSLLSDIKIWMARRKLKLNDSKTEVIIVRGNLRNNITENFGVLNFGGAQLLPCETVKNLGVTFDSTLSFNNHIDSIVKNCNFHIRNLYAIKKFVNRQNLLTLIHSLVVSRVDYCNSLLVGLPNKTLRKLQSVLNRAARLVFSLPPRVPTTPSLIVLHWLPVRARVEFKICLMAFKALKFQRPKYIADLLIPHSIEAGVVLRSTDDPYRLHEPRAVGERSFAVRSFAYTAPRLYNRLPVSMKLLDSVEGFKERLKAFIFHRAYSLTDLTVKDEYRT